MQGFPADLVGDGSHSEQPHSGGDQERDHSKEGGEVQGGRGGNVDGTAHHGRAQSLHDTHIQFTR